MLIMAEQIQSVLTPYQVLAERNVVPFFAYLAACAATYGLSHLMACRIKNTRPKETDIVADADLIFSVPMYAALSILAILGTTAQWNDGWHSHWFGNEGYCRHFTLLYAAMNLVHVPITIFKRQDTTYKVLMTGHHMLSIGCMLVGLKMDRMYFFAALDGVCEISTFTLTTLFILKEGLIGTNSVISALVTANGIALWFTYLVFRIFLFPFWLYTFFSEAYANPDETFYAISTLERWLFPIANIILLGLSSLWFLQITKGMLKQIKKSGEKSGEKRKKSD
eukprot:CAMPEP_0114509924 /NCGR_PEP_ID=MMETSP0109-20121206/13489_1 /TAXON_ID=29199 /ORGANISM="Chlorarachnion reptans, Strain CCCM449" /LENGTH=279 /DNA_ID=CAMNT_0001689149 /DNA_START=65 /DNA_END=904 /DNA_ORIENTATION=+